MGRLLERAGVVAEIDTTPPPFNLARRDVEGLVDELKRYHHQFRPLFEREEQRHWAEVYLHGVLSDMERKTIEPLAERLEGGNVRNMQHFIGQSPWDDAPILRQHRHLVDEDLGEPEGVLIVDGSDFPKQGEHSAGVARQWCGALGKTANCQAGVFVAYASSKGHTLVDRRLYLPEEWFSDAYAQRRRRCGVPDAATFQTKPQLAQTMLQTIITEGQLRFGWVVIDAGFGDNPSFRDALDELAVAYLAEVACDTRVWLKRPSLYVPPPTLRRGRPASKARVVPDAPAPQRVDELADHLAATDWTPYQVKEGTKGPMVYAFACRRVVEVRDGLPGPERWLVLRRKLDDPTDRKYFLSNAPADTPSAKLVWLTGMRWPVETAIEEGKGDVGMDHYETRSWQGWHHHMTLTLLAHHFLVRLRLTLKDKAPALTVPQVRQMLQVVLPKKNFSAAEVLDLIERTQRRNHAAYVSHRKRTVQRLDDL